MLLIIYYKNKLIKRNVLLLSLDITLFHSNIWSKKANRPILLWVIATPLSSGSSPCEGLRCLSFLTFKSPEVAFPKHFVWMKPRSMQTTTKLKTWDSKAELKKLSFIDNLVYLQCRKYRRCFSLLTFWSKLLISYLL